MITASVFVLAFSDALSKQLSGTLSIWQIFLVRSLFALPILGVLFKIRGSSFRVHAPKWVALRSVLLVMTWICYYGSFPFLNLSVAAVAIYTFPILIALFSTFLTKEPATPRQWSGISLGFVGVMIILQPGTDAFSWVVLLPVLGAGFLALAMILTRLKCQHELPIVLSFWQLSGFFVAGLLGVIVLNIIRLPTDINARFPFIVMGWGDLGLYEAAVLLLVAVLAIGIFSGIARAYQIAPAPIVATFDYVYLLSATLWGFVLFAEKPGLLTIIGMAVITVAGILVALPAGGRRAKN